jgi:hypothetical protein
VMIRTCSRPRDLAAPGVEGELTLPRRFERGPRHFCDRAGEG